MVSEKKLDELRDDVTEAQLEAEAADRAFSISCGGHRWAKLTGRVDPRVGGEDRRRLHAAFVALRAAEAAR